jgi:hypothetical protein
MHTSLQALAEAQQAAQTASGRVTTLQERVQQLERFLQVSQGHQNRRRGYCFVWRTGSRKPVQYL